MYGHGGRNMGGGSSGFGPYHGGGNGGRGTGHGGFSHRGGGGGGRFPADGGRGGSKSYGGGGRGGGGGKRHQGDSATRKRLEADGFKVVTNLFPLVMKGRIELTIHQFEIKIENARKKKTEAIPSVEPGKDVPEGAPDQAVGPPLSERRPRREINEKSSPLSRRILLKCQEMIGNEWFFVTDGAKIAYSIHAIPEKYDVTKFTEDQDKNEAGIIVQVKDGDDRHRDALHVTSKKYNVSFLPVGDPFRIDIRNGRVDYSCHENLFRFSNFMHLLLNNASMKAGMISTKKNPERYYFPLAASQNLLGRNFREVDNSHPLLALSQSINMAVDGSIQIQSDFSLGWFEPTRESQPLLDRRAGTFAGVAVRDFNRPITNVETQKAIKTALKPLLFDTRYECGPEWEARERSFLSEKFKGREDLERFIQGEIAKRRVAAQLNRRMVIPEDDEQACIKFVPNEHTFSFKAQVMTVQQYFKVRYDVDLAYPYMPLIRIRKRDYMPAEFLFRAFDEQRNANSDEQKKTALQLCDEKSGSRRVSHIEKLNEELPLEPTLRELLGKLEIERKPTCLQVDASVLKEPEVVAGDGPKSISKGSWDCRRVDTPGVLNTIAVIDLTSSRPNPRNGQDVTSLLQTCHIQGIVCQTFHQDEIDQLTVPLPTDFPHGARVDLRLARTMAAEVRRRAYQFFLQGGSDRPFKTTVRCMGELKECVVFPFEGSPLFYLEDNLTHEISGNPDQPNARYGARLCFLSPAPANIVLDPFRDFSEFAKNFDSLSQLYRLADGTLIPLNQVKNPSRLSVEGLSLDPADGMIDCPSIVIVRLRDKDAMQYSLVKYALYEAGLQSQCFVNGDKFRVLTRNLAIKINAKLSNSIYQSSSWKVHGAASEWLEKNGTLVIGYSFAGAQGRSGNMVVAASSCIDDNGLSMRHANIVLPKSSLLTPVAAEKLISTLYDLYVHDRKQRPRHLLIFRCNGQDSELKVIGEEELGPIESIFRDKSMCNYPEFPTLAPVSNPKVTFLVAQTLNKVKIAPAVGQHIRLEGNNVPSGTCVTESRVISQIIDASGMQVFEGGANRDFILVPQHGLKGTSKPVYYRVLKLGIDGSQQNVRDVTYSLSFRYATATKAPRLPAVLLYSQRIAGVILSCLPELQRPRGHGDDDEPHFQEANAHGYFSRVPNSVDHMVFIHVEGPTAFHPHLLA